MNLVTFQQTVWLAVRNLNGKLQICIRSWKQNVFFFYEIQVDGGYSATVTSDEIEQAYLDNPHGIMAFSTAGHEYVLDFTKMVQKNLYYKTEREVARRPLFLSEEVVQGLKIQLVICDIDFKPIVLLIITALLLLGFDKQAKFFNSNVPCKEKKNTLTLPFML